MGEPQFYIKVARDFIVQARKAIGAGVKSLGALGLVLAVENSVLSLISCFRPPIFASDAIVELRFLVEEHPDALGGLRTYLEEFVELSQHVIYTYHDLLIRGDLATNRTPSEILSPEDLQSLAENAERAVRIAERLSTACRDPF